MQWGRQLNQLSVEKQAEVLRAKSALKTAGVPSDAAWAVTLEAANNGADLDDTPTLIAAALNQHATQEAQSLSVPSHIGPGPSGPPPPSAPAQPLSINIPDNWDIRDDMEQVYHSISKEKIAELCESDPNFAKTFLKDILPKFIKSKELEEQDRFSDDGSRTIKLIETIERESIAALRDAGCTILPSGAEEPTGESQVS